MGVRTPGRRDPAAAVCAWCRGQADARVRPEGGQDVGAQEQPELMREIGHGGCGNQEGASAQIEGERRGI